MKKLRALVFLWMLIPVLSGPAAADLTEEGFVALKADPSGFIAANPELAQDAIMAALLRDPALVYAIIDLLENPVVGDTVSEALRFVLVTAPETTERNKGSVLTAGNEFRRLAEVTALASKPPPIETIPEKQLFGNLASGVFGALPGDIYAEFSSELNGNVGMPVSPTGYKYP